MKILLAEKDKLCSQNISFLKTKIEQMNATVQEKDNKIDEMINENETLKS